MSEPIKTKIPAEMEPAAVGGMVTDAKYIIDRIKNKNQTQVNAETEERVSTLEENVGTGSVDQKINAEKERAEGVEATHAQQIDDLQAMEQIVIDGGEAQIAQGSDFDNPDSAKRAKIPTVGAVLDGISEGVFNLTAKTGESYASLQDALTAANTAIPANKKKGGMSIKYVQTSDNKYVQYRLTADEWSTDTDDWAIADTSVYVNNLEWLYVVTDSNGRILFGLKTDGSFCIYKAAFLDALNRLNISLNRLNISALEGVTLFDNEEWLNVETDKNGNLLSGTKNDGSHYIHNVKSETLPDFCYADSQEWLLALLEARNRLLCGIKKDGTFETKKINTKELCVSSDNGLYNFLTTASKNKYNKEILSLHPETEIVPILRNYKFWGYQYNNTHPNYKPLTLLWFTDLHKDSDNLSRISKFFSTYKSSGIDDVIFTGDATDDYTDNISFWGQNGGKNILFCVGNHEVCIGSTFVSPKQAYDKYLAPNIENWDAETNEDKCYWYKDYSFPYSEECPSGIRIISLDMYHWKETTNYDGTPLSGDSYADGTPYDTGEQESWFIDVLDDAKDNGFAVIVLVHGPKNDIDELSCSFNTLDKITLNERECFKDDMLQDVADFIEAGGEFICWLCGHTHQDWFGTIEGQPLIVVGTSSHITKWRGDDMVVGTKSQDRFNLISIEPVKKYIRIHRIGLEYDRHGRYINEIVYDYQNKSLISNF